MRNVLCSALCTALAAFAVPARAVPIGGVEFPQGAISFADAVVTYAPGPGGVTVPHQGAFNALGVPDYAGDNSCASQADCTFVSLGDGGSIVLRFDDNKLTGSGTVALDLWIFEVGPDIEDMFVDISKDGSTWHSVGAVGGATAGIDIDAFGWGVADLFGWVRLTDDGDKDGQAGSTVGADIDAVGAISTVITVMPEPGTAALLATLLLVPAAGGRGSRARR